MLGLPPSVRIYFATELVDMRNGIDGLRGIVEAALKKDAYQGHLFVFVGRAAARSRGASNRCSPRGRARRT